MIKVGLKRGIELNTVKNHLYKGQQALAGVIDMIENLQVRVEIPGINESDLDASIKDGVLIITSKSKQKDHKQKYVVAVNRATQMAVALAEKMAFTNDAVVIYGAIGTGKSLLAQTIHESGQRKERPFVRQQCGVSHEISDICDRAGAGTIYLDDLDEMDCECLNSIRQVAENKEKYPCRLIVAISRSKEELSQHHEELADLLGQLRSCVIELPCLSERDDDIEPLAYYHLERMCREKKIENKNISPEFIQMFKAYSWPGNVRELINTLDQVIMTAGQKKTLFARDLPNHIRIQALKNAAKDKKGL